MHVLGDIDVATFLSDYWQKQPLLIRNALPGFSDPVTPEELAGLALDDDVESRLIMERDGAYPWQLRYGPFQDDDFTSLPPTHWTLLVQEANTQIPALARLLEAFHFIPQWRIDDVMVSFAPDQGSVGPHIDQYDVFLIQGMGQRHWQIHTRPISEEDLIDGLDLRILKTFDTEQEWILDPGDMLYLPPGVAHYGIARGDCLTYSVGFRAPGIADMLTDYTEGEIVNIDPGKHYTDPDLIPQAHSGEIPGSALSRVREILGVHSTQADAANEWFGMFITAPAASKGQPVPLTPLMTATEVTRVIQESDAIYRSEYFRFAYIEQTDGIQLYINGTGYWLDPAIADLGRMMADQRSFAQSQLLPWLDMPEAIELLTEFFNLAYLYQEDDDE
jgi:50S ribosomal protein L16 3-hydroxylase